MIRATNDECFCRLFNQTLGGSKKELVGLHILRHRRVGLQNLGVLLLGSSERVCAQKLGRVMPGVRAWPGRTDKPSRSPGSKTGVTSDDTYIRACYIALERSY